MKKVLRFRVAASTVFLLCMATAIAAPAQTFTTLASFDGTNGASAGWGSLVQGFDGNFYGTTVEGGTNVSYCTGGCGTVFKVTPGGTLTSLHSFSYSVDGADPYGGLLQGSDGNLYGAIYGGAAHGDGAVFRINYAGTLTTLYSFGSPNGAGPFAGLVQATDGNLYGTTYAFGAYGVGTVFKTTLGGALTTIYSFCAQANCADGEEPIGGLIQATDGNLYGTTTAGGSNNDGTVFKLTPEGALTTLHSFDYYADGAQPRAQLLEAANGELYGTTYQGGSNGAGTLFKITTGGELSTLYNFCAQANCADGADPLGALVQGTDGKIYGTASVGGANGWGTLFRITPQGGLITLYEFCPQANCADGGDPFGGLIQATDGSFYGAAGGGGTSANCSGGCGTVYSLSVGLGPFVKSLPTVGKVGSRIIILGNALTGTTSVTFNGIAATFTVASAAEIKATVPTGATSGKVQVTTPHGVLTSNVVFRVK